MSKFDISKFTVAKARPLPVILLLDVSGSMAGKKIEALNKAVREMIESFSKEEAEVEIIVSIITFGGTARLHLPYTKASEIEWRDMTAGGMTPMGAALKIAKEIIEDREKIPSRAYRPTVVLVSDGMPNDHWEKPLEEFIHQGRSSKCDRMAMAIGRDADENVLKRFIEGTEHQLFYAHNANELFKFFRFVTMSVVTRSKSKNPNVVTSKLQENSSINKREKSSVGKVSSSISEYSQNESNISESEEDSDEYW